ncbi:MAG: metallophosphoesterase [Candidatus Hodarchaeota archaeon]
MRIGVISDTHDNLDAIKAGVEILIEREVQFVFHAGDLVSPFTAKYFSPLKDKFVAVYGNNDGDKVTLKNKYESAGLEIRGIFAEKDIGGRKIALIHGTTSEVVEALVKSEMYDIVLFGHSHRTLVKKVNNVLVVNPGEACGYLHGKRTLATIDTKELISEIVEL